MLLVFYSNKKNVNCELQWKANGSWLIRLGNEVLKAELKSGSVVTPVFSLLKFVLDDNKNFTVILFKDSIDIEKFRQLRVRINVEGLKKNERDTLS